MELLNKLAKALQESLQKWLEEAETKAKKREQNEPMTEEDPFTTFERIEKKIGAEQEHSPIKKDPKSTQVELDDEAFETELLELKKKFNEK